MKIIKTDNAQFQPGQGTNLGPTTATVGNGDVQTFGRTPSSTNLQFGGPNNFYIFQHPGQYSITMHGNFADNRSGLLRGSFTGTTGGVVQSGIGGTSTSPVGPARFHGPPQGRVSPFLSTATESFNSTF